MSTPANHTGTTTTGRLRAVRRGFRRGVTTIAELIVVIALSGIVLAAMWQMTMMVQRARTIGYHSAGMTLEAAEVDADLRGSISQAGMGMAASWNVGGVAVATSSGSLPSDTLTLLLPASSGPASVSTTACTTAPGCVRVRGDQTSNIPAGSVVWVGTPRTGAQLMQVTAATTVQASCGADCATQEAVLCADSTTGSLTLPVVTGSVRNKSGVITNSSSPCPASVFADGTICDENTATQAVGNRVVPSCTGRGAPGTTTFTDLSVTDVTASLGYPPPPASTLRSGARGTPAVLAIPVIPVRYTLDRSDTTHPKLMRAQGIDASGAWHAASPVAVDIQSFAVNVQHADTSGLVRGIGVTSADLSTSSGNTNYSYTTTPGSTVLPGINFRRSYRSIALVQVVYTIMEHEASPGPNGVGLVRGTLTASTLVATPQIVASGLPSLVP